MPTGYTAMIDEDPTMTTARWVREGLARAFGVCIALRDESFDLTEGQIIERITKDAQHTVDYHNDALEKAKARLNEIQAFSKDDWTDEWKQAVSKIEVGNTESKGEADAIKARHDSVREDLRKLGAETTSESVKRLVEFGLNQLNLTINEEEGYHQEVPILEAYITHEGEHALWYFNYHIEELEKAKKRLEETIATYSEIQAETKRILGN